MALSGKLSFVFGQDERLDCITQKGRLTLVKRADYWLSLRPTFLITKTVSSISIRYLTCKHSITTYWLRKDGEWNSAWCVEYLDTSKWNLFTCTVLFFKKKKKIFVLKSKGKMTRDTVTYHCKGEASHAEQQGCKCEPDVMVTCWICP